MISLEIQGGKFEIGTVFSFLSQNLFDFPLLIFIPPLLPTHLSLLPTMFGSSEQAAHYHILIL
jgi:hypothetical protein